ncbi:hypothetical protein, partial [Aureimonas sp. SK2]|uniref:hypothetical protein n=1 Tax=Aureimonas sp. SK2 TaxID=3015992 RepID=UPI002444D54B
MAKQIVEIRGAKELKKSLERLEKRAARSVIYGSLDDVARDANERLAKRFESDIEGGPVDRTKIRPGQKRSSVYDRKARRDGDGVSSSIQVAKKQAAYLGFQLGEQEVRTPGVVGAASEYNFLFVGTYRQSNLLGIKPDRYGNMPRNTLRKLIRASRSQKQLDEEGVKRRKLELTKANLRAERARRNAALDRKANRKVKGPKTGTALQESLERIARTTYRGEAATSGIFFGRLRKGSGNVGFWQRPPERSQKPSMIVLGVKRSRYRNPRLTQAWNDSVQDAMAEMPRTM